MFENLASKVKHSIITLEGSNKKVQNLEGRGQSEQSASWMCKRNLIKINEFKLWEIKAANITKGRGEIDI